MPSHTDEESLVTTEQRFRDWGTPCPHHSSLQWALPTHRHSLRSVLKICICRCHALKMTVPASSLVWNPILCSYLCGLQCLPF